MIKDEFSVKIGRLTKSSAYLNYCEEVYGYRAYLFNMLDKQQMEDTFGIKLYNKGLASRYLYIID